MNQGLVGLVAAFGMFSAAMGQNSPSEPTAIPPSESSSAVSTSRVPAIASPATPSLAAVHRMRVEMRMKTPFGDLITPNITPDVETDSARGPPRSIPGAHDGVGKKVGDLYPVMPYTFYTR